MLEYKEAAELMSKARNPKKGKPLQNNTRLYEAEDDLGRPCYEVWLHNTPVVTIYKDGTYKLQTGGWATVTTKDRLNTYGPGTVTQMDRVWYWEPKREWNSRKNKYEGPPVSRYYFHDGMIVTTVREITRNEDVLGPGRWNRYY